MRAVVRLREPEIYHDPGVWSREDFLVDQGITSTATVSIDRVESPGPVAGRLSACVPHQRVAACLERAPAGPARGHAPLARSVAPSQDDAIMLAAMVTGDRTYLTHSLRVGFERTGSFHMLVVSGFHLAIVAGMHFLDRAPSAPAARSGHVAHNLRFVCLRALYRLRHASRALAVDGHPLPLGRLLYRERSPLNTIGFAALCLLAVSPRSLFDASLQMTLLAVVSIAGVAAPLLQSTIHPYLTATRDLWSVDMDYKLPPRLAQFRVMMRMIAPALQAAVKSDLAGALPHLSGLDGALRSPFRANCSSSLAWSSWP